MTNPLHMLVMGQSTAIGVAAALVLMSPRLAPLLVGVLSVSCLLADYVLPTKTPVAAGRFAGPVSISMAALAAYALSTSLWAQNVSLALQSGTQLLLLLLAALYLGEALPRRLADLDGASRRCYLRSVPIGVAIGLVFLVEEFLSGHRLMLGMIGLFPALAGVGRKGLVYSNETLASMHGFYVNQNVAALVLLAPSALAAATLWLTGPLRAPVLWLAVVLVFVAVFASDSETAKLACVTGLLVWPLAHQRPKTAVIALACIFATALLFAPVLGRIPATAGLHKASWVPVGVRDRVVIWDATARTSMQAPFRGIGMQSTRFTNVRSAGPDEPRTPASQLGWHSHNAYLQAWLELGLIGVLALLALGLSLILSAGRAPAAVRPAALALAASALAIAGTGWGMWQPWLVASVIASVAFLQIAATEAVVREMPKSA